MTQPTPPEFQPSTHSKPTAHSAKTKSKTGQPLPPNKTTTPTYENNPFTIAASGIDGLFSYAKVLAIIMLTLSLVSVLANAIPSAIDYNNHRGQPTPAPAPADTEPLPSLSLEQLLTMVAIFGSISLAITLVIFLVSAIFTGLRDVAAAAVANERPVSFGGAFTILFGRFGSYLWLQALIWIKVFLWSLLFIVPGIVMAVRYSLAGTAFFSRDMKAREALARSTKITKGGWLTTVASYSFFNLITFGCLSALVETGTRGVLYRQFDAYETAGIRKPSPHWLTITCFVLLLLLLLLVVTGGALLVAIAASGFSE